VLLRDQFEWDLYCPENSPEDFAKCLAADLGIGGEYVGLIAHAIHEQLLQYKKERLGSVLGDDNATFRRHRSRYQQEDVRSLFRYGEETHEWAPTMDGLTQDQIEKLLIDRERSAR
jgi:chromatin structure-remodeling complex subunit SFH1